MGPAMLAAAGVCAWVDEATCSMPSACKWRRLPKVCNEVRSRREQSSPSAGGLNLGMPQGGWMECG